MSEQLALSQQSAPSVLKNTDATPLLSLSSADTGWEGLAAETFRQPVQLEGLIMPERSDISLMLLTGGAMRGEQRHTQGPWNAFSLHHGDLVLSPAGISYEVRKKSLSSQPTQTLHLYLSKH